MAQRRTKEQSMQLKLDIFKLHAQRLSNVEIGERLECTEAYVRQVIAEHYKNMTAPIVAEEFQKDLELLHQTLRVATERYLRTQDPADYAPVEKILTRRAKMLGYDSPDKIDVSVTEVTQEDIALVEYLNEQRMRNANMEEELRLMVSGGDDD